MENQLFTELARYGILDAGFITSGDVWFVDSGGTNASDVDDGEHGKSWLYPLATIDYAVGLCTASAGDIIYVAPGHAETIATNTDLVLDVIGVKVIGLGIGSLMPLLTLSAAASTISITAANCMVKNIGLLSSFTNGVTNAVLLGATADGCILDGLRFQETTNAKEILIGISITADCDDVIIRNCRYMGIAGGTSSSAVKLAGGCDRLIFENNYIHGDFSSSVLNGLTAASADIQIIGNRSINIDTAAGLGIDFHDSSTGIMSGNHTVNLKGGVEGHTGNGLGYCENYCSNVLNVQGFLLPVADS